MSPWEIAGVVLGVLGVWLMIRQRVSAWPVGMVQVGLYGWIFFEQKLYSDALLQGVFFILLGYGWWRWWRGRKIGAARSELPVTTLGIRGRVLWMLAGAVGTAGWGTFMHRNTDAALPYWDAFILVFSLIAQGLQAVKRLENWVGWMIVNLVAIGVYWVKDLRLTAGLYGVFLIMAVLGWREWNRSRQEQASA